MTQFFKIFLSPLAFAVGFLWPLMAQTLIALGYVEPGWLAITAGAAIAIPFGLMAQFKGSWIWIR